ncbi:MULTISPECIES: hypothetical protein [unclassified Streptomyces]|uniref:hypothetical protein n=1 Tax=unclassified Streptomyces TaxID=2593676 RepID=UPI0015C47F8B|nr:hypothetical protein [Streptomyces sp. 13-12-16]
MSEADPFHEAYEDDEPPPSAPPRPVRLSDGRDDDLYGVVRAGPSHDDPQHDEVSPRFEIGAPTPATAAPPPEAAQQSDDSAG